MGTMNLRRALANDAPKLARVHVESWQAAYQGIVPGDYLQGFTIQKREQAFRRDLESDAQETYLLEEEGLPVAILTIGSSRDEDLNPGSIGEIWGIYISPSHWRHGVGRMLVGEAEKYLQSRGYREIVLWVLEDNMQARYFYEAMGYHQDGTSKVVNLGKPLKAVRYAKKLNADED